MAQDSREIEREDFLVGYTETLPFSLYPFQEESLLAWFTSDQGVLVCAPTGMGKTVIAEAAMFEALHTGKQAYYTTPLIALTDQKFHELQQRAESWGFSSQDVGLVTGNRRINPDARLLVVVAEILLNRLLQSAQFDMEHVSVVVMDEFHSFADPERGIVWEMTLGLLPPHVRTLLLSATVGNAQEFSYWLERCHQRRLTLVQSDERRVPLTFQWVPDKLLDDLLPELARGSEAERFTPALVFCFNRDECWARAEQLKGKRLIDDERQSRLDLELRQHDWTQGAGPKLKQILQRGVGVHHAGVLGKYRRIVEHLFQQKLMSVCVCTETLAAGINLPARSVVLPSLVKGPFSHKKLIDASSAHQMFGRAGRPQFDSQGFVFAMAHEDDVKIAKWREQYDRIPDDSRDPNVRRRKKELKKKAPKRRTTEQYWTEEQFLKVVASPPGKLYSRGQLPWRVLVHALQATSDVAKLRTLISKRLMDPPRIAAAQRQLDDMLIALWRAGYVELEPHPNLNQQQSGAPTQTDLHGIPSSQVPPAPPTLFGQNIAGSPPAAALSNSSEPPGLASAANKPTETDDSAARYHAERAVATDRLVRLTSFRGIHPFYGDFVVNHLGVADEAEILQITESVLELAVPVARMLRVPSRDRLPAGPLAVGRIDPQLLSLGLATEQELLGNLDERDLDPADRVWPLTLAEKMKMLFEHEYPAAGQVRIEPVWAVGELFEFGGDFNKFIVSHQLQKQEGIVFRHLLRMVLLLAEFSTLCPPDADQQQWAVQLGSIRDRIVASCQKVDPTSTQRTLEQAAAG